MQNLELFSTKFTFIQHVQHPSTIYLCKSTRLYFPHWCVRDNKINLIYIYLIFQSSLSVTIFAFWSSSLHRLFKIMAAIRLFIWWWWRGQWIEKSQLPRSSGKSRNNLWWNNRLFTTRDCKRVHFTPQYRWKIHFCWSAVSRNHPSL